MLQVQLNLLCLPAGDQASLREENDSLRWQLDAYRNEVDLLRKEQSRSSRPDEEGHGPEAQIQLLQQVGGGGGA